jgi:hypothetical protein
VCHFKRFLYGMKHSPREDQHPHAGLAGRKWVASVVHLRLVHLYLPHRDNVRHDCTLRGWHPCRMQ